MVRDILQKTIHTSDRARLVANLVLMDAVERLQAGNMYAEVPRGLFLIRGENVVLLGEIVRQNNMLAHSEADTGCSFRTSTWMTPLRLICEKHLSKRCLQQQSKKRMQNAPISRRRKRHCIYNAASAQKVKTTMHTAESRKAIRAAGSSREDLCDLSSRR